MAWSITQGVGATPTQKAVAANGTATLTITPTAVGSTLFATIGIAATANGATNVPSIASVSDSVDGAWTLVQVTTSASGSVAGNSAVVAYRDNASSTAARTVTLTNGTKAGALTWALGEATHSGITFAVDGTATAGSGATTAATSVTVSGPTPSVANGLALAVGANDGGSSWTSPTGGIWSVLWSLTSSGAGTDGRAVGGTNPTAGSAMSTTFTESGASFSVPCAVVVVFQGASGGVSENLTDQTATFTEGSVEQAVSYSLTALTATFAEGTITASTGSNVNVSLTAQTATFSEGTISPNIGYLLDDGVGLGGQVATFTEGTPTETVSYALTGQTITASEGAPTSAVSISLTGQTATFAEGTISAAVGGNVTTTLAGQTATFTEGTITAQTAGNVVRSLTALQAVFSAGTITAIVPGGIAVPDLTGLPWVDASQLLIASQLTQTQAPNRGAASEGGPGIVTAQNPAPGAHVAPGTNVQLTVSPGYLPAATFDVIPWYV